MILVEVLNYLLVIVVGFLIGYYSLLGFMAFISKKKTNFSTAKARKYAIVLYSQNEGNTLSRSLYSLSGMVYPKNKYDLFVIANNLSDDIIKEAEKLGAIVLMSSKGDDFKDKNIILEQAFDYIIKSDEQYDALIVFSSDCLISGNYLEVMNYYLENGSEVVQSCHQVLPHKRNWIQKVLKIEFLINNKIKPLGRKFIGLSMQVRDTGICFSTSLLREIKWNTNRHMNILEYGSYLQLKGIQIDFAPEAIFFSKVSEYENILPYDIKLGDKYKIIKKVAPSLFKKSFKDKSLQHFDRLMDLVLPSLSTIVGILGVAILFNGIGWSVGWLPITFVTVWLQVTLVGWICVGISLIALGEKRKLIKSMMYFPIAFYIKARKVFEFFLHKNNQKSPKIDEKDRNTLVFSDDQSLR